MEAEAKAGEPVRLKIFNIDCSLFTFDGFRWRARSIETKGRC